MTEELNKAKQYTSNGDYHKAIEVLLNLEQDLEAKRNEIILFQVLDELFKNYKLKGDLKPAYEYYKKLTTEEFRMITAEYKEKTDKLNSALKIHSSQKETELLQEKNNELNEANKELNILRDVKNELITTVSEELKVPIVTLEGISLNYYKALKDGKEINPAEIKSDLENIQSLSQQVLKNVNSILEKNKAEHIE